jgi:hypothetical protein
MSNTGDGSKNAAIADSPGALEQGHQAKDRTEISERLELVAQSLRGVYPLETDCEFDRLLHSMDQ